MTLIENIHDSFSETQQCFGFFLISKLKGILLQVYFLPREELNSRLISISSHFRQRCHVYPFWHAFFPAYTFLLPTFLIFLLFPDPKCHTESTINTATKYENSLNSCLSQPSILVVFSGKTKYINYHNIHWYCTIFSLYLQAIAATFIEY